MADRLRARGDSWGEFVELLANMRIDEEDRKAKERASAMKPILPPPHAVRKEEKGKPKPKRGQPTPEPPR